MKIYKSMHGDRTAIDGPDPCADARAGASVSAPAQRGPSMAVQRVLENGVIQKNGMSVPTFSRNQKTVSDGLC